MIDRGLPRMLAAAALLATTATTIADNRDVQIRTIDFADGLIRLHNFGVDDIDLTGWRFCSHDTNQQFRYTIASGLDGFTIEAGTSVWVHFNNDAPGGDPDRVNRSALGNFAVPLDPDAYSLQIFFPAENGIVTFGNSALIADHVQWNVPLEPTGTSQARTGQAVSQLLWSAVGDFVSTSFLTDRIELNDLSNGREHGPSDYDVIIDLACPGDTNGDDVVNVDDLNNVILDWGTDGSANGGDVAGALPGSPPDGIVDVNDLNAVIVGWGMCP